MPWSACCEAVGDLASRRGGMPLRVAALASIVLVVAACGSSVAPSERVVEVRAPSPAPREPHRVPLQPPPTPTPVPPTPDPALPDLDPPAGAFLLAGEVRQQGAARAWCWRHPDGRTDCPPGSQTAAPAWLPVGSGDEVTLLIEAGRAPDHLAIRVFREEPGESSGQPIDPALESRLSIELDPGDWRLDACATWSGYVEDACWVFALRVS